MRSTNEVFPSFFIVGAPKCGTTALYSYLREHPDIFLPDLKEPHYFSTDLPGLRVTTDMNAYCALFRDVPRGKMIGDASASYLHSRDAIAAILAVVPKARMVVMLRDPVEMAAALHAELLFNLTENIEDFHKAWNLQDTRARGTHLPRHCREPQMLRYRRVCALGDHLERLQHQVPEEQRLVLLLDDLREKPGAVYRRVLAFLGLPDDGRENFPRENPNKAVRSRYAAALHGSLPKRLGPLYRPAKAIGNALGIRLSTFIARHNVEARPRSPLDPVLRNKLAAEFAPQVATLSRLLGRDLSHWSVKNSVDNKTS